MKKNFLHKKSLTFLVVCCFNVHTACPSFSLLEIIHLILKCLNFYFAFFSVAPKAKQKIIVPFSYTLQLPMSLTNEALFKNIFNDLIENELPTVIKSGISDLEKKKIYDETSNHCFAINNFNNYSLNLPEEGQYYNNCNLITYAIKQKILIFAKYRSITQALRNEGFGEKKYLFFLNGIDKQKRWPFYTVAKKFNIPCLIINRDKVTEKNSSFTEVLKKALDEAYFVARSSILRTIYLVLEDIDKLKKKDQAHFYSELSTLKNTLNARAKVEQVHLYIFMTGHHVENKLIEQDILGGPNVVYLDYLAWAKENHQKIRLENTDTFNDLQNDFQKKQYPYHYRASSMIQPELQDPFIKAVYEDCCKYATRRKPIEFTFDELYTFIFDDTKSTDFTNKYLTWIEPIGNSIRNKIKKYLGPDTTYFWENESEIEINFNAEEGTFFYKINPTTPNLSLYYTLACLSINATNINTRDEILSPCAWYNKLTTNKQ